MLINPCNFQEFPDKSKNFHTEKPKDQNRPILAKIGYAGYAKSARMIEMKCSRGSFERIIKIGLTVPVPVEKWFPTENGKS